MIQNSDRFTVSFDEPLYHGEPISYEVRKNSGGTSCDWDSGEFVAMFGTEAEAQAFIQGLAYARGCDE